MIAAVRGSVPDCYCWHVCVFILLTFTVQFALICKWSETIFKRLYAALRNTAAAAITEAATAFVKATTDRATVNNSAMLVNSELLTAALW